MMPEWLPTVANMVVGLASGWAGAYYGLKIAVSRLEWNAEDMRKKVENLSKRSDAYNEDLLIHDLELEDVMRNLNIPRKRRQNWRFD